MKALVNKFWQKIIALTDSRDLWVAYSGGQDSRVLLELCAQGIQQAALEYKLQAIHIDHGLHQDSAAWAQHCNQVCAQLGVTLHIVKVNIDRNSGESIEALARAERRRVWQELLPTNAALLLAHHQDDQAETVLHRLFRGAGPTGLSGMAARSKFGKGQLLRPLLTTSKQEIVEFANNFTLSWIIDPSNSDCKFDRNFIRHEILPQIRQRWPKVDANIARSASLCREQVQLALAETEKLIVSLAGSVAGTLAISKLLELSLPQLNQVIRYWITTQDLLVPSMQQLQDIQQEVLLAAADAQPNKKIANYELRRYRDDLYLRVEASTAAVAPTEIEIVWNIEQALKLPNGLTLTATNAMGQGIVLPETVKTLTVCLGQSKGECAKKVFQAHAIPLWERGKYPLLFLGQRLVAIVGLWRSPRLLAAALQTGVVFTSN